MAGLQAWVAAFLGEVTAKTGSKPMIYTSPAFWSKYMGDSRALADAGYKTLWIAHWGVTAPTVPAQNWGGHGWTFWQYTSSGAVSGITGRVDLDRFNGADLATQGFSIFKLAASIPGGSIKQGASSVASVAIMRTNFTSGVALDIAGMPAGTTATFDTNPTTLTVAALTVTTPGDPTATPVGTYPLTITGVADGLTRTTTLNLVVADGTPPTVSAPKTYLVPNKILGLGSVPIRVAWSASDASGVAGYGVQHSINGAAWAGVALPSPTVATIDETMPYAGTARQQVQATDARANTSAFVGGPVVHVTVIQQSTTTAIHYTGTWRTVYSSSVSGGSLRYATAAGASATYRFTGSSIAWVTTRAPGRGSARVLVDGVAVATVNLLAQHGTARIMAFARTWPTVGTHTIQVVVVGTAGHPRVDLDAFVRLTY